MNTPQNNQLVHGTSYYRVAISFIKLTTPVYIAFFGFLTALQHINIIDFDSRLMLFSIVHMLGLQIIHFTILQKTKSTVTKSYMQKMLWFLVMNNGILFAYWLAHIEGSKAFIYIIASMSTVSLFSVASFRQSMFLNNLQVCSFALCIYFNEYRLDSAAALANSMDDFIYLIVLWVVCAWLSLIADSHMRIRVQRDQFMQRIKNTAENAADSELLNTSALSLSRSAQQLSQIAQDQQQLLSSLATTSEQLRATSEANVTKSTQTLKSVESAQTRIIESVQDMQNLNASINEVKQSGDEIKAINNLMNDIAYQTNILSLNAMIEASRATDNSGGFKVVAHEVKNLAERSSQAAANISQLLDKNTASIDLGVHLSNAMQERFESISDDIKPITVSSKEVSEASREQSYAIAQISDSLQTMDQSTQQNLTVADETLITAHDLKMSAGKMAEVLTLLDEKRA